MESASAVSFVICLKIGPWAARWRREGERRAREAAPASFVQGDAQRLRKSVKVTLVSLASLSSLYIPPPQMTRLDRVGAPPRISRPPSEIIETATMKHRKPSGDGETIQHHGVDLAAVRDDVIGIRSDDLVGGGGDYMRIGQVIAVDVAAQHADVGGWVALAAQRLGAGKAALEGHAAIELKGGSAHRRLRDHPGSEDQRDHNQPAQGNRAETKVR